MDQQPKWPSIQDSATPLTGKFSLKRKDGEWEAAVSNDTDEWKIGCTGATAQEALEHLARNLLWVRARQNAPWPERSAWDQAHPRPREP